MPTAPTTAPACRPGCMPAQPGKAVSTHEDDCEYAAAVRAAGAAGLGHAFPIGRTVELDWMDGTETAIGFVVAKPDNVDEPNTSETWVWVQREDDGEIIPLNADRAKLLPAIPTDDYHALYELIASVRSYQRHSILTRLERQTGDRDRAFRIYDDVESDVRRDELVTAARADLAAALAAADTEIGTALDKLKLLTGDLGDEDLANARLLTHHLGAARISVETAVALGPKGEQ